MTDAGNEPWMEGFEAYRAVEIDPLLDELERSRLEALRKAKQRIGWVIPPVLIGLALLWTMTQNVQFTLFASFACAALGYGFARAPLSDHGHRVKRKLITRLCDFFGLAFEPRPVVTPVNQLRALKLVPSYDRKSAEDRISGRHGGVDIELVELHLEEKRRSKNSTYYVTVFRGPVFVFSFPKRFNGRTIVRSDATALGNWLTGLAADGERVRLEDPEFERHFEVYGTDQVEARYLLTPGFMDALLQLRQALNSGLQAAFAGGELLITANNSQDRFESGTWSPDDTMTVQVERFIDEIGIVFRIIDDLNLRSQTRL